MAGPALVVALALVGVLLALLVTDRDGSDNQVVPTDTTPTTVVAFSATDARRFEDAVNSRDPDALGGVLVVGDQDLEAVAVEALPEGTELAIEESTFTSLGQDAATVEATLTGAGERFGVTLYLTEIDGVWLMAGSTEPLAE